VPDHRRLITAEDLFRFRLVSDAQISPDGANVVYVSKRTDVEKNKYFSGLWLVSADGEGDRPFTQGDQSDHSPRWAPDGRSMAFVSDRGEKCQLWRIPFAGGEAAKLTDLEEGAIGEIHWSPDGTRIAFTYRTKPPWARKEAVDERKEKNRSTPPLHVRRLRYREEGSGYFGDERWHVFVLDAASGAVTQLTQGETDQSSLAWSPDGERIAFITNRSPDPDRMLQYDEIRIIPSGGGEEARVEAPDGPKGQLTWSPDGRTFAYYGHTDVRDVWSPADPHLWALPAEGGQARDLSGALDRPVGDFTIADVRSFGGGWTGPVWSPDSTALYFLVSDRGLCHVYRAAVDGGDLRNLTPGLIGEAASLSLDAAGQRAAAVIGEALNPGDVYAATVGGGRLAFRRCTSSNEELLGELDLAEPEETAAASDGGEVHGWILRPPLGARASCSHPPNAPLILYIHGGPHTQYGWAFMHEFQLLAARGFAVLYTNPRGSRGYGQRHVEAIRGDWGGPDFRDLMAATDRVLTLPGIDTQRLGVTGGSYGGFMTNWIVGHTDRFRCAATQRSVVNLQSMAGTCDFNFGETEYFGGNAWDAPERLLAQSPLTYAARVRTPLLILHSEGDLRCPIEQAEQLFAALKDLEREVELVRYPREANHGLSRTGPPDLRLDRLQRITGWMERWLAGEEG
jgi:dipeptidyl aminopeptidase/acylaminoacyl peptidase